MKCDTPTIPCKSCDATGRRTLSQEYLDTLQAFPKRKRRSCPEVLKEMISAGLVPNDARETIIHKRVSRLVKWGLLKRIEQVIPNGGKADPRQKAWVFERV